MTAPLVVLVATLFVTMAMAAMTLVPRPPPRLRHIEPRLHVRDQPAAVIAVDVVDASRCRAPVHRANPDGTVDVTFETCGR